MAHRYVHRTQVTQLYWELRLLGAWVSLGIFQQRQGMGGLEEAGKVATITCYVRPVESVLCTPRK